MLPRNARLQEEQIPIVLDTTMGKITLDMLSDVAPGHCNNMLGLAKIGYYDGLGFHRIIKRFMIQGGCRKGPAPAARATRLRPSSTRPSTSRAWSRWPEPAIRTPPAAVFHLLGTSAAFGQSIHGVRPHRRRREPVGCESDRRSGDGTQRSPQKTGANQDGRSRRNAEVSVVRCRRTPCASSTRNGIRSVPAALTRRWRSFNRLDGPSRSV